MRDKSLPISSVRASFFRENFDSTQAIDMRINQETPSNTNRAALLSPDQIIQTDNYLFLLNHQDELLEDLGKLFAVLKKEQEDEQNRKFWFYCYYCASLLQAFNAAYGQVVERGKMDALKKEISNYLNKIETTGQDPDPNFWQYVVNNILESVKYLATTPMHSSQIKDSFSYANLVRINYLFVRLSLTASFNQLHQFDESIDFGAGIKLMEMPNDIGYFLSVFVFGGRLLLSAGTGIKHAVAPSATAAKTTTKTDRAAYDAKKYAEDATNDFPWLLDNLFSNYTHILDISDDVSMYITVAGLFYDSVRAFCQLAFLYRRYKKNEHGYIAELNALPTEDLSGRAMLQKLQEENKLVWLTARDTHLFVLAAATILAPGFLCSMVINPIPCFLICLVGVAMYRSVKSFNNFREKSYQNTAIQLGSSETKKALAAKEYKMAKFDFSYTLLRNVFMPLLVTTGFATFPPLGIVLVLVSVGMELSNTKKVKQDKEEVKELEERAYPKLV